MKIKRSEDKKKKELTEEEKELRDLKRAKNIGLASMGIGGAGWAIGRLGLKAISKNSDGQDKYPSLKEKDNIKPAKRVLNIAGPSSIAAGLALHGISAVKYRKLKKKLDAQKKEEEEPKDDNSKKEK